MNVHIIENGSVTSTIVATVAEAQTAFPTAICIEATEGGIGWVWDGVTLTNPNPPGPPGVPISITPRQGYIILSRYGILAAVKAYFAALEGQAGEEAQIELEFAQEWKRTWPTLISAATSFGLTDVQIDQMFVEASAL